MARDAPCDGHAGCRWYSEGRHSEGRHSEGRHSESRHSESRHSEKREMTRGAEDAFAFAREDAGIGTDPVGNA
jgi:hypothetical protein